MSRQGEVYSSPIYRSKQHPFIKNPKQKQNHFLPQNDQTTFRNVQQTYRKDLQKIIFAKINQVDEKNKQLLQISNRLSISSIANQNNVPMVIYDIEEHMKKAFNDLIDSISEFYIDIDGKIKQISTYLANYCGNDVYQGTQKGSLEFHNRTRTLSRQQMSSKQSQNLESIARQVRLLQKDLQQTKSNQRKLMQIIQNLVSKYELFNETTIVKDSKPIFRKWQSHLIPELERQLSSESANQNTFFRAERRNNQHLESMQFIKSTTNLEDNFPSNQRDLNLINPHIPRIQSKYFINESKSQDKNSAKFEHRSLQHFNGVPRLALKSQRQMIPSYSSPQKYLGFQDQKNFNRKQIYNNNHQIKENEKYSNRQKQYRNSKLCPVSIVSSQSSSISIAPQTGRNEEPAYKKQHCFIKKLHSRQSPTKKVSLKGQTGYFQFKSKQSAIDEASKTHRETYLMKNLIE